MRRVTDGFLVGGILLEIHQTDFDGFQILQEFHHKIAQDLNVFIGQRLAIQRFFFRGRFNLRIKGGPRRRSSVSVTPRSCIRVSETADD